MRVLIAGGAGEVGTYLARDFSNWGHEVTVIDRVTRPEIVQDRSITYLQGTLTDAAFVGRSIQGMEMVIHIGELFASLLFGNNIVQRYKSGIAHLDRRNFVLVPMCIRVAAHRFNRSGWPDSALVCYSQLNLVPGEYGFASVSFSHLWFSVGSSRPRSCQLH
jgi:NAD(P)-dependent dehydrogenase (short-subunit alcohol dehydrogenase family)